MKIDLRKIGWMAVSFICGFMACAMFIETNPSAGNGYGPLAMQQITPPPQSPMQVLWTIPTDTGVQGLSPASRGEGRRLPWDEITPNTDLIDTRPPRGINPGQ